MSTIAAKDPQQASLRLLAVECDPAHERRLRAIVADADAELTTFSGLALALAELATRGTDCMLLGATPSDPEALGALAKLRAAGLQSPVVVLAASADRASVARAVEHGAQDLLLKGGFDRRLLMRSVEYAIERRGAELELAHQALHDPLTGLANRALYLDRLARALAECEPPAETVGVLLIDLDRFGVVNESLGHDVGDRLLLMISERIAATLAPGDLAARFGGDEFALLLHAVDGAGGAGDAARRLEHALSAPFTIDGESVFVRFSAGIGLAMPGSTPDELLRDADAALHRAKERGGGTHEIFKRELHERAMRRLRIEHSLHAALLHEELTLSYQPQFELGATTVYGVEALVRWNHPVRGLLPPAEFIGAAEETGLVVQLGAWVLRQACRQALLWPVEMSVNVAARQCMEPGFVDQVDEVLRTTGIDPSRLCLELTETAPIRDDRVARHVLGELKAREIVLAVDDFGTGYSSLQALRSLPFDVVKIDKSFIDAIHTSERDAAVVAAVVDMARALGMKVVAEGVEHAEQVELLLGIGCEFAQGFHLGRPDAPERLERRFELGLET